MSAPPPSGPHGPNQGPNGPQQPGPHSAPPQGGPSQAGPQQPGHPQQPPPGWGQQPPPGYGPQPQQGFPVGGPGNPGGPGGPAGPYGAPPQGPPGPQQPPSGKGGGLGGRKGWIIGGAVGGALILVGGFIFVLAGSGPYGVLAEDQCDEILPEGIFEEVADGQEVEVEGEFEEYDDGYDVLNCRVGLQGADEYDYTSVADVTVAIHDPESREFEEALEDMEEDLQELEEELEPGEPGRPSEGSGLASAGEEVVWGPLSLGDGGAVVATPSQGEDPTRSGAYFQDQNAFFGVYLTFGEYGDIDPLEAMSINESLGGDVRKAVRAVNQAP